MGFLDSLDSAVGSATGVRGSVALSATFAPVTSGVIAPIAEAFTPADPTAPPAPSNPARTVSKVAGAALAAVNAPLEMMNNGFAMATNSIAALFPTLPAATIGSLYLAPPHGHMHPPSLTPPVTVPIPLPSLGPVVLGTCIKVLINGMPAARAGDIGMAITCVGILTSVTHEVSNTPPSRGVRPSDGSTIHEKMVDGVQWTVIKKPTGEIVSSFPTGGAPYPTSSWPW